MNLADEITINQIQQALISQEDAKNWFLSFPTEGQHIGNKLSLYASCQGEFRRFLLRKIDSDLAVDRPSVQQLT